MVEGPHPHRLPQYDLLRQRRLRDPTGGADVLRQGRLRADARRGGAARGDPGGPVAVRPRREPAPREGAPRPRARADARAARHLAARLPAGDQRAAAEAAGRAPPRHAGPGAVLRQLREAAADRPLRRRPRVRRRPEGEDDDRPAPAEARARGDRQDADQPGRPDRRARGDRPAHRSRADDDRRQELSPEPVQPRGAGRAAAGLLVQAVRARDGARVGDLARDDAHLEAPGDLARRPRLVRPQLRGQLPRPDQPHHRDGRVGQHRLRAADADRRAVEHRQDRAPARDHEPAPELLRDRARRRGGQPARDGAGLRFVRQRRAAHRRAAHGEPAGSDRLRQRRPELARSRSASSPRGPTPT